MTEEEQKAMLQFFGTIHAQAKATDQMIVGQSNYLKPISTTIQNDLQHALAAPVAPQYIPPPNHPVEAPVVHHAPPPTPQYTPVSPIHDETIYKTLEKISDSLERIANILESSK